MSTTAKQVNEIVVGDVIITNDRATEFAFVTSVNSAAATALHVLVVNGDTHLAEHYTWFVEPTDWLVVLDHGVLRRQAEESQRLATNLTNIEREWRANA